MTNVETTPAENGSLDAFKLESEDIYS